MTKEKPAPNEPEVKAQGFERDEAFYKMWEEYDCNLNHGKDIAIDFWDAGFSQGQKSKAATLKLPSEQEQRKFVDLHFCHSGLEYNSWEYVGEDALELLKKFCDAVKSMNERSGE